MTASLFWIDVAAYSLTTLISTALLLAVIGAGPRRRLNLSFALLMLTVSLWSTSSALLRITLWADIGRPQFWIALSTLTYALIGPALLVFGSTYTQAKRRWPYAVAGALLAFTGIFAVLLFQNRIFTNVELGPRGTINWARTWLVELTQAPLAIGALLALFLLRKRPLTRRQFHMPVGIALLAVGALAFGFLFLPNPSLSIAMLIAVGTMGHAVLVHQLFNPLRELTEHLEELSSFNENIIQSMEGGILVQDQRGFITFVNPQIAELLGYTPDELIGQHWATIVAPEYVEMFADIAEGRSGEATLRYDLELVTKTGQSIPFISSTRALEEGEGSGNLLTVLTDITERKQTERLLTRERKTLFSILKKAPYGVVLIDKDEKCLYVNAEFTRITGYALEDIPTIADWFRKAYPDPDYRRHIIETWKGDTAQRISREFSVTCKDGSVKEVEFRPTLLGDGRAILVLSDVTQQKRAQAERERLLAELERRSTQLRTAAEVSKSASLILDPDELIDQAVNLIQEQFDFYYVGLFLLDEARENAVLRAGTGEAGRKMLERGHQLEVGGESMIGWSVAHAEARIASDVSQETVHFANPFLPDTCSELALPLISRGHCIGALTVQSVERDAFSESDVAVLRTMSDQLAIAIENTRLYESAQREIAVRKQAEEELQRRNRELALLYRATRALISTLDLDQVLAIVLDEARRLMEVVACSVWLIDPTTDQIVCRQATGPKKDLVRGWRLDPDEGLVGWVASHGESLIVADAHADDRYFEDVDQSTGLDLRSIISVPLQAKRGVIGVLQAVDSQPNRFDEHNLDLLEPLAATAAIAIDNARLYEQAREDAAAKSVLLREIDHRVKNNLSALIGLLHSAARRTEVVDQSAYQSIIRDLINRLIGLAKVHDLLSASQWTGLRLSELAEEIIKSSTQTLSPDQHIHVDVSPSPVKVNPDQAHNLTLVINELTTNTIKHALRDRQSARITVSISRENDKVRLEFRDDGPGYPERALEMGEEQLGLDLMQSIVHRNLRGKLALRNDDGAVAVIEFTPQVGEEERMRE